MSKEFLWLLLLLLLFWIKLLWLLSSLAMMEPTIETIFPGTFPFIYLWVMLMSAL